MTGRRLSMLLLILAAASSAPAALPPKLEGIEILPPAGDGRWRATYRFSAPADGVVFNRQSRFQRVGWRAETPGYTVSRERDRAGFHLKPRARARRSVTISFPFDTTHPEKDYQLFQPFSDGSLLLYTGHLGVRTPHETPARFVVTPRRGEHVIAGGRLHRKRFLWTDPDSDGTFLYYGKIVPVVSPGMLAIIDPGAPAWLIERLRAGVPALFDDYVKLTGFPLDKRPAVFFSFEAAADPNSTTWKGGTLTGLIQMHVETARDAVEDRPLLERFFKFLAHEAAHLWNGQMFKSAGKNQSWMHEGGADAFAWRALHRAGILTSEELLARQALDLNLCLSLLGEESLAESEERGNFGAVYPCGSALAWLAEASVRKADPSADLHTLWRDVFARAASSGRRYDEAIFLDALRRRTADEAVLAFLDGFLHEPMPDRVALTIAAFARAGVKLEPAPAEAPRDQRQRWSQNLLVALVQEDCNGAFSFTRRGAGWVIHGGPACATLKSDVTVETAEGHSLVRSGDTAYDAVAARCAAGESVTLEGSGSRVLLRCSRRLRPRPPWLIAR